MAQKATHQQINSSSAVPVVLFGVDDNGKPKAARFPEHQADLASKAAERTPQSWIEDIRKLVADGKLEQADREIADFKKRYPDFALPNDLR